ncbi:MULTISPECIES: IS5 family transposase [unclassified Mesorhizobium]|uniref:IS5 family transposase n=1 Tax=unclassified Mesorhizobium TaxID=325217 RepID=UPI000FE36ADE|nr:MULTISPECIES: IS5 family transposase [unclassified Mesorhizobium]RWQ13722.1 MAG: IS5 family transposase [Mesorhizobium sp.]TGQ37818.1 IS5 family transposase [Mesorhizobium sp. M4B.F.Ca.ET.214.01.1.1]TGQ59585.1 IS5 family transposase [Mesorhizobium sp. M4B.F.Ca.ET.211.01.1.1]TGU34651.1 IS5 family transposase [Mesorhizobium sp. M4B.F.Ca.ET.150.01.1.1]
MRRYGLRDDQWDRVKDFLPAREGHVGGTAQDNRLFVEAVLYRYRAGIPRRDLPPRFGDWKIVWQRFDRWAKSGVFDRIFKTLASDHDNEYMWLDATIVRAHQHSAGAQKSGENQAIGRSRGGLTTKIHAVVDALGNPLGFSLTPPQASDLGQAGPLLDQVNPQALLADEAYDADALIQTLKDRRITPVIPPKANRLIPRQTDFALYRERNLVEPLFNKLKHFRAIATRCDKTARNFLAAVQLVAITFLLN